MQKSDWENYLTERLVERLDISLIRARDLAYQHDAIILQAQSNGSTPNQAASAIITRFQKTDSNNVFAQAS